MKYCKHTTESHPLSRSYPQFLNSINSIIKEEHGTHFPFNAEVALELDKIKNSCQDKKMMHNKKSMDMVIGVKDGDNSMTLLVEFKLDCKQAINLKGGDLLDKINDSKLLLFGSGIHVHNEYVFVFNDKLLNESRRVISSRLTHPNSIVLSIDDLKRKYF